MASGPCPPCKYPNPCVCDEAVRLQEEIESRPRDGIVQGHVLDMLARLPADSMSCVVTSPPYWSLRKYAVGDVVWGGDPDCPHTLESGNKNLLRSGGDGATGSTLQGGKRTQVGQREAVEGVAGGYTGSRRWQHSGVSREETPDAWVTEHISAEIRTGQGLAAIGEQYRGGGHKQGEIPRIEADVATCSRCGAWRGQYGLEPTPELYVEHTLDVLRAIRRVLRPDGVVWWNIGDSYSHGGAGARDEERWPKQSRNDHMPVHAKKQTGLKPKDLLLMPQRIALAAQDDGWWVRSMIVWSKPNAMPESTKDRPSRSHEYVLMLTKNGAKPLYWYNRKTGELADKHPKKARWEEGVDWYWAKPGEIIGHTENDEPIYAKKRRRVTLWRGVPYWYDQEAVREAAEYGRRSSFRSPRYQGNHAQDNSDMDYPTETNAGGDASGRNMRDVWVFPTAQTPEAHFATFPEELPRRCIEASCPREICVACGKARVRLVERQGLEEHPARTNRNVRNKADYDGEDYERRDSTLGLVGDDVTVGWSNCGCGAAFEPGIVLDPFAGIGTTGIVAKRLGRRFIGIELSEEYAEMARKKLSLWWRKTELTHSEAAPEQMVLE